jgi:hypothetical protein
VALSDPTLLDQKVLASNAAALASNAITPASNTLLVVVIKTSNDTTAELNMTTTLANVGAWTIVAKYSGGAPQGTIAIAYAVVTGSPGTGTITANWTTLSNSNLMHVMSLTGFEATPVVQSKLGTPATVSASSYSLTLDRLPIATSCVIGALVWGATPGDITPGANFTEVADQSSTTIRVESEYDRTNATTTVDWSVGASNTGRRVGIAIEVASGTAQAISRTVSDNFGLSDTVSATPAPVVADSEDFTDTIAASLAATITDSEGFTDTVSVAPGIVLTDSEGFTDGHITPRFRSISATATGTGGLSGLPITINVPGDIGNGAVQAGDMMVAFISSSVGTSDTNGPAGWNLLGKFPNWSGSGGFVWIFTRPVVGAEPANYTWAQDSGLFGTPPQGFIIAYSNVDAVDALGAIGTGNSTTPTAPTATVVDNAAVIYLGTAFAGGWGPPAGYTARSNSTQTVYGADLIASPAGPTGPVVGSLAPAAIWGAVLLSLKGTAAGLIASLGVTLADNEGLTDVVTPTLGAFITDSEGFTDTVAADLGVPITDTGGFTDSISVEPGVVLSDQFGLTDLIAATLAAFITDREGFTDELAATLALTITDSEGFTDTVSVELGPLLADTVNFTDTVVADIAQTITDLFGLTDNLTDTIGTGYPGCAVISFDAPSTTISFDAPTGSVSFDAPSATVTIEDC